MVVLLHEIHLIAHEMHNSDFSDFGNQGMS